MTINSYLSMLESNYTQKYGSESTVTGTGAITLDELVNAKYGTSSSSGSSSLSDYDEEITAVAEADAKADLESGDTKSWKNSDDYYDLKDEYISSSDTSDISSLYSTYNSTSALLNSFSVNSTSDYLTEMNKAFVDTMQSAVNKQVQGVYFDAKYNYAYKAYMASAALNSKTEES